MEQLHCTLKLILQLAHGGQYATDWWSMRSLEFLSPVQKSILVLHVWTPLLYSALWRVHCSHPNNVQACSHIWDMFVHYVSTVFGMLHPDSITYARKFSCTTVSQKCNSTAEYNGLEFRCLNWSSFEPWRNIVWRKVQSWPYALMRRSPIVWVSVGSWRVEVGILVR